jgi:hypothetical protein
MTDTTAPIAPTVGNNDCGNANVINVGVPGNIRPVILAPGQSYTVADVVNLETRVQPGQTVLLLKAVRGA